MNTDPYLQPILDLLDQIKNEGDAERFLDLLLTLREVKRDLTQVWRDAEHLAADAFDGIKNADVGPYRVEVRHSKARRWDNDSLRSAVLRVARFDPETGEARDTDTALRLVDDVFNLSGSAARTTALKRIGIDPDEYSEGDWKTSVTVNRIQPEGSNADE